MSGATKKLFTDEDFVTITDPENPLSFPIAEGQVGSLTKYLEIGHYEGFIYDEETDSDVTVHVYVSPHGVVAVEK